MPSELGLLVNLLLAVAAAFLGAFVAVRLGQSVIPGYLASVVTKDRGGRLQAVYVVEVAAEAVVLTKPFRARRGEAALHVLDRAVCGVLLWRPKK